MNYDVMIVGGGPSGLTAAIRLKQLAQQHQKPLSVCVLEKASRVGAHSLSGAVLNPRVLKQLLPDRWQEAPLDAAVLHDYFYWMSERRAFRLPTPRPMKNHGNYIIRLGFFCEFLAQQAEQLGCEIYAGFPAKQVLFNEQNTVIGVQTGEFGLDRQGQPKPEHQPGMDIHATYTLLAEGCRGELSQQLMRHYQLRESCQPQTYALGIKELWQLQNPIHPPGTVIHTVGWPLDSSTYGGSFLYFLNENLLSYGFVVGLDYQNPYLSPFDLMQQFKTHPQFRSIFAGGERIGFGARALNEGGWQAIPKLTFPGGALIGDGAGFLNVPEIKGIHHAMESGVIAAEQLFAALQQPSPPREVLTYSTALKTSPTFKSLYKVRNIRPGFRHGLYAGLLNAAWETYLTQGHSPWTLKIHEDYLATQPAANFHPITYPKPDNVLTFDRTSSIHLCNLQHDHNQPNHLQLRDPSLAISLNYTTYASPETRYCPANVYEIIQLNQQPQLQINAQNCIHCKTCDIKDPTQNIHWTAPEGGSGPNYSGM